MDQDIFVKSRSKVKDSCPSACYRPALELPHSDNTHLTNEALPLVTDNKVHDARHKSLKIYVPQLLDLHEHTQDQVVNPILLALKSSLSLCRDQALVIKLIPCFTQSSTKERKLFDRKTRGKWSWDSTKMAHFHDPIRSGKTWMSR